MKLAGDLAEFSLADLVQVAGLAGRTCGIKILAAEGNGTLFLEGGEVVGAIYEDLAGFDAFVALMTAHAGHFQVENGATAPERNLQGNVQRLLLEANSRIEAGEVPRPRRKAMPAAAPLPSPATSIPAAPARRSRWFVAGAAALLLLAAVSWLAFARHDLAANGAGTGTERPERAAARVEAAVPAVEATQLGGAGDALPALVSGTPPATPDPASGLKPTIVCRLRIDATGKVAEAKIYRSRMDLAAFEEAALDAVQKYRFTPGRKAGKTVPVWMSWPVTFR